MRINLKIVFALTKIVEHPNQNGLEYVPHNTLTHSCIPYMGPLHSNILFVHVETRNEVNKLMDY